MGDIYSNMDNIIMRDIYCNMDKDRGTRNSGRYQAVNNNDNNRVDIVKHEVQKFFETTSVKGIPRAAKSSSNAVRFTWFIVVIICLTLAIWQTTVLIREYLEHSSITVLVEHNLADGKVSSVCRIFVLLTF